MSSSNRHYLSLLGLCLLVVISLSRIAAASSHSIDATATLSRHRIAVGEMVQLDVKVTGAEQADIPSDIAAEGLQIKLTGQSSEVQMINFKVSSSVIYSYIVIPLKSGNLTIPSISVRAAGEMMKTSPLSLEVIGTGQAASPRAAQQPSQPPRQFSQLIPNSPSPALSSQSSKSAHQDRLGFVEVVIPKKRFYVGEVVPVEIRFYVDAHYGFSTMGPPHFGGEGILTDRFKDPEQSREDRNGTIYNVATFRTLFAAVKAGGLDLPATTLDIAVAVPEAIPAGIDPTLFSRLLGGGSLLVREQKMTLKSETIHCDVVPLPAEGRPKEFSGAIGEFRLEGSVTPERAAQGDPITLSLKLSGKGNFQALKAPLLTETEGWRSYPPTEHFESTDFFGWKGVKSFDTTMIAQQPVKVTPGSSFSYFDPVAEKYVTLTTPPLPVEMTAPTATNTPAAIATPTVQAAPPSFPSPPGAIVAREALQERGTRPWRDLLHQERWVIAWLSLLFLTLAAIALLAWRASLQAERSPRDREQAELKRLLRELQQEDLSATEFYERAAAAALLLLKRGVAAREDLEEIVKRRDEIHYGARVTFLTSSEKERLIALISSQL